MHPARPLPEAASTPPATALEDLKVARLALATLDLTSLRGDEDPAAIDALVARAAHPAGPPAALCVYPAWVTRARRGLDARGLQGVRVATVVAFPQGDASPARLAQEVQTSREAGADEIDMVLPWRALQAAARGQTLEGLNPASAEAAARASVAAARAACGTLPLKVILESGELAEPDLVALAARLALEEGADFIKTSTGKARVHATPQAVQVMLDALARHEAATGRTAGLKVAGGVQTLAEARLYLGLAMQVWGPAGLHPGRWRFGASSLWPVLVAVLEPAGEPPQPGASVGPAAPSPEGY